MGGYTHGKPHAEMLTGKVMRILDGESIEDQILILGRAYVAAFRKVGGREDIAVVAIKRMFDEARNSIITDPED